MNSDISFLFHSIINGLVPFIMISELVANYGYLECAEYFIPVFNRPGVAGAVL